MKRTSAPQPRLCLEAILFFAGYILLPEYFGLELHAKLPLITASRLLLVILGLGMLLRRRQELFSQHKPQWSAWNFTLTADKILRLALFAYFALMLCVHGVLLPVDLAEAVKGLFALIVESLVLVWLLTMVLTSRKKLETALQVLLLASGVCALVAISGCITGKNPFHLLDTVRRDMLMSSFFRLGALRAAAGFGHPVYYGAFCAVMLPIGMYFVDTGKGIARKCLFSGCLIANMVALILSNSRGSLLAVGVLLVVVLIDRILRKEFRYFLCTYLPIALVFVLVLLLVTSAMPAGNALLSDIFGSVLNEVLPSPPSSTTPPPSSQATLPEGTTPQQTTVPSETSLPLQTTLPEESVAPSRPLPPAASAPGSATAQPDTFGNNPNGISSRLIQFSGIRWTLQNSPVFGFGRNAHVRGHLKYMYHPGHWTTTSTIDMGLVAIISQFGLVGLVAYICLYSSICLLPLRKTYRSDRLLHELGLSFLTYLLCQLSIAEVSKLEWVLIGCMVCLVNIIRKEQTGK